MVEDDKQRKGRPGPNQRQNRQVRDAAIREGLSEDEMHRLRREVEYESRAMGADLSFDDLCEIARIIIDDR